MKKGDKLLCVTELPLFKEGEIYEVIFVDEENIKIYITLNQPTEIGFELEWILQNFKKV